MQEARAGGCAWIRTGMRPGRADHGAGGGGRVRAGGAARALGLRGCERWCAGRRCVRHPIRGGLPGDQRAFDGSVRHGWVPERPESPAFSAGIQSSLWALFLAADVDELEQLTYLFAVDGYASLPLSAHRATAVGGSISRWHAMPYLQMGSKLPEEGGWGRWSTRWASISMPEPRRSSSRTATVPAQSGTRTGRAAGPGIVMVQVRFSQSCTAAM